MDKNQRYLKWGILAGIVVLGGRLVLPILNSFLQDVVTLQQLALKVGLLGVGIVGLWMFLPAISELLASVSYRAWCFAIGWDPVGRQRRDYRADAERLASLKRTRGTTMGKREYLAKLIEKNAPVLSEGDVREMRGDLRTLDGLITSMDNVIKVSEVALRKFEGRIQADAAKWEIKQEFKRTVGAIPGFKKVGEGSEGSKIAQETIDRELEEARGQMKSLMSDLEEHKVLLEPAPQHALSGH